jgi:hypothetical protein
VSPTGVVWLSTVGAAVVPPYQIADGVYTASATLSTTGAGTVDVTWPLADFGAFAAAVHPRATLVDSQLDVQHFPKEPSWMFDGALQPTPFLFWGDVDRLPFVGGVLPAHVDPPATPDLSELSWRGDPYGDAWPIVTEGSAIYTVMLLRARRDAPGVPIYLDSVVTLFADPDVTLASLPLDDVGSYLVVVTASSRDETGRLASAAALSDIIVR